jgi:hypothetical protein
MTNLGHVYIIKARNRDELNNLEKERTIDTFLVNMFQFILLLAVRLLYSTI